MLNNSEHEDAEKFKSNKEIENDKVNEERLVWNMKNYKKLI